MRELTLELDRMLGQARHSQYAQTVQAQVGSGMRGDKRRTYRERDDIVKDDVTGRAASYVRVMRGNFDMLWD